VWLGLISLGGVTAGSQQRTESLPACCAMVESIEMRIIREAIRVGLQPERALRVAFAESRYQVDPPKSCCFGIFQLHPKSFPGAARMTPQENIRAGVGYLAENARKYGAAAERVYRVGHT
jgi:hypothetical protein